LLKLSNLFFQDGYVKKLNTVQKRRRIQPDEDSSDEDDDVTETKTEGFEEKT